jgi:hypothetical protein
MMRLLKAASVSTGFAFRKIIAAVMAIGHLSGPNDPSAKTIRGREFRAPGGAAGAGAVRPYVHCCCDGLPVLAWKEPIGSSAGHTNHGKARRPCRLLPTRRTAVPAGLPLGSGPRQNKYHCARAGPGRFPVDRPARAGAGRGLGPCALFHWGDRQAYPPDGGNPAALRVRSIHRSAICGVPPRDRGVAGRARDRAPGAGVRDR